MISVLYNYVFQSAGVSQETQAVLDRAALEGIQPPGRPIISALDTLIRGLVLDGVWSGFDRLWVPGFNDNSLSDFARISIKNADSSGLAEYNGGVSYMTGGWSGNGLDGFVDTNYNPIANGSNYQLNSASRIIWVYQAPTTGTHLDGVASTTLNQLHSASVLSHRINSGNIDSEVDMSGNGYRAIDRRNNNDVVLFRDTSLFNRSSSSTVITNDKQSVLKSGSLYSNAVISAYGLGRSFSNSEHQAIRSRLITFFTNIGLITP